jgi:20S proteasome alpha/beta subunit
MQEYQFYPSERATAPQIRCSAAKSQGTTTMTMKTYDRVILTVFMVLATSPMLALAVSAATH